MRFVSGLCLTQPIIRIVGRKNKTNDTHRNICLCLFLLTEDAFFNCEYYWGFYVYGDVPFVNVSKDLATYSQMFATFYVDYLFI